MVQTYDFTTFDTPVEVSSSPGTTPKIIKLTGGGYVVAWTGRDTGSSLGIAFQRYDASGTKIGPVTLGNIAASSSQQLADLAALPDGGFVLAWQSQTQDGSGEGVYVRRFNASGVAQGGEVRVNTTTQFDQSLPAVSALANGYVVVWQSAASGDVFDIYMQRFDATGTAQGVETRVNTGVAGTQTTASVATLTGGDYVVVWASMPGSSDTDVYLQRFSATGVALGGETRVNTVTLFPQTNPSVTALAGGGYVVAWQSPDGKINGIFAQAFDATGTPIGGEIRVNGNIEGDQTNPDVSASPDGGYVITWQTNGLDVDVFGQVIDATGAKVGGEFRVNSITGGSQSDPDAIVLDNGRIVIVWQATGQLGGADANASYLRTLVTTTAAPTAVSVTNTIVNEAAIENIAFATLSTTGPVNDGYTYTIRSDSTGGAFAIVGNQLVVGDSHRLDFETAPNPTLVVRSTGLNGTFVDQTFTLTVTNSTDETRLSDRPEIRVTGSASLILGSPEVGPLNDGSYVVTFRAGVQGSSANRLFVQRYDASGAPVGSETLVATPAGVSAAAPNGTGYVVVFASPEANSDVFLQRFGATGTAQGPAVRVNTYTTNIQSEPDVAALSNGGYVVTWTSLGQDGDSNGVYMQRYDAAGVAQGVETRVNTTTAGGEATSSVAALAGGGYVVSWRYYSSSTSYGVFQRYDAAGVALGDETRFVNAGGSRQYSPTIAALADGGFVTVSTQSDGVYAQRYDASGVAQGAVIQVAARGYWDFGSTDVAALPSGGFAVIWGVDNGLSGELLNPQAVYMRRYDPTGLALDDAMLLSADTGRFRTNYSITALSNGSLVVIWHESVGSFGSSPPEIKSRLFVNDGIQLAVDLNGSTPGTTTARGYPNTDPATVIADAAIVTGGPANFGGGSLTASVIAGGTAGDRLSILDSGNAAGQIGVSGDVVRYGGVQIGTVTGGTGAPLVVTLNAAADRVAVQALTRAIAYANTTDATISTTRTVQFAYTDGQGYGLASGLTATLTITAFDAPPVAVADGTAITETAVTTVAVLGNDTDTDGGPKAVVSINGTAVTAGGTVTLASGATARLNADGTITYDPNGKFSYLVASNSGTGGQSSATDGFTYALNGGSSASVTVTINGVSGTGDQLRGTSGNETIFGLSTADYVNISQGGTDIVSAGDGNDTIFTGAGFSADDVINGGAGNDQITLRGSYTGTLGNVVNTEFLGFLSGTSVRFGGDGTARYSYNVTTTNATVAAGVAFIVQANELVAGENLRFDGSAELDGSFVIYAGRGVDTFIGGAGNDSVSFGEGGRFTAADTVNGGAGSGDQLVLRGNYAVTFAATTMTNVETVALLSATVAGAAAEAAAYAYNLTLDDAAVATGQQLRINAAQLVATESARVDGAGETNGTFVFVGGAGADIFIGGSGTDSFSGGLGGDTLTGGLGNDIFQYRTVADSTPGLPDTITDLRVGDRIDLGAIDAIVATPGTDDVFSFIGSAQFTAAGQLRVTSLGGGNYLVEGDVDGINGADFAINVASDHPITAADFVL